jgi:hypothetical protein
MRISAPLLGIADLSGQGVAKFAALQSRAEAFDGTAFAAELLPFRLL